MARQSNYVFQLDPNDNSRVISYFKSPSHFHAYLKQYVILKMPIVYAYEDDYFRLFGRPRDGKNVFMTRDQRFCISIHYAGPICKYDKYGNFVEETNISEWRDIPGNCKTHSIGRYTDVYGWKSLVKGNQVWVLDLADGYFWSFEKHDKIPTCIVNHIDIQRLDPEVLHKFSTGEYARINPRSREMQKETRKRNQLKRHGETQNI